MLKEKKPKMESDMEEEPEEVFNDTIQGVVESIEVTEPGPETEPEVRTALSSKKVLNFYLNLSDMFQYTSQSHLALSLTDSSLTQRLDTGKSEVSTRKKQSIDDTPHQVGPGVNKEPHKIITVRCTQLFVEMDELRGEAWVETARFSHWSYQNILTLVQMD